MVYFVDDEFFDVLGKKIWLFNFLRGKIVEMGVLIRVLKLGKVGGVGFDVNEFEKSLFEDFFDWEMLEDL